jgi:hypothetical protein
MKSIIFLTFFTLFIFAKEDSNAEQKQLVDRLKSYLVIKDNKVIGVKVKSEIAPTDLKDFLKSLKDIVSRKDKEAFSKIFNKSPNCGVDLVSKRDLKKICLEKLFSNKNFWSLISTFIDHGVAEYEGKWVAPPQLKPNKIFNELLAKLFITNWGDFPYRAEFSSTYDYIFVDKLLKVYNSPNSGEDFETLPANHFFTLNPSKPCVSPDIQKCTPWQEIETINGKTGYVNLRMNAATPIKSMTGLWISRKDGKYFVESVRLDSPCSSHCKPEYDQ